MKKNSVLFTIVIIILLLAAAAGVWFLMDRNNVRNWSDDEVVEYCQEQTNRFRIQGVMRKMYDTGRISCMFDIAEACDDIDDMDYYEFAVEELFEEDYSYAVSSALKNDRTIAAIRITLNALDNGEQDVLLTLIDECGDPSELMKLVAGMNEKKLAAELVRRDYLTGGTVYLNAMRKEFGNLGPDDVREVEERTGLELPADNPGS